MTLGSVDILSGKCSPKLWSHYLNHYRSKKSIKSSEWRSNLSTFKTINPIDIRWNFFLAHPLKTTTFPEWLISEDFPGHPLLAKSQVSANTLRLFLNSEVRLIHKTPNLHTTVPIESSKSHNLTKRWKGKTRAIQSRCRARCNLHEPSFNVNQQENIQKRRKDASQCLTDRLDCPIVRPIRSRTDNV